MRTDYDTIQVEADGGVVTITLNRPEHRNTVTLHMERELGEAMWGAEGDDDVRAIVVTGAGRSFCSGIDMSEGGFGEDFREQHDRELGVTSDTLWKRYAYWEMSTPVIGAIKTVPRSAPDSPLRCCSTSGSSPRTPSSRSRSRGSGWRRTRARTGSSRASSVSSGVSIC